VDDPFVDPFQTRGCPDLDPTLLLGPYGGLIADRMDKRKLMVGLQALMGVQALILGVLTLTHRVTFIDVCVLAVALGLNNCFENPARQAFVLEMVGADLKQVVGLLANLVPFRRRTNLDTERERINIDDAMEANDTFEMLMGDEVPPRKKFIQLGLEFFTNRWAQHGGLRSRLMFSGWTECSAIYA
jgi:hypothetical protein